MKGKPLKKAIPTAIGSAFLTIPVFLATAGVIDGMHRLLVGNQGVPRDSLFGMMLLSAIVALITVYGLLLLLIPFGTAMLAAAIARRRA